MSLLIPKSFSMFTGRNQFFISAGRFFFNERDDVKNQIGLFGNVFFLEIGEERIAI